MSVGNGRGLYLTQCMAEYILLNDCPSECVLSYVTHRMVSLLVTYMTLKMTLAVLVLNLFNSHNVGHVG